MAECAQAESYIGGVSYNCDMQVNLEKQTYLPGDEINARITLRSMENFTLTPASVIVHLVKGGENRTYPSQASDQDNVFQEKIIGGITLSPYGEESLSYSYKIPQDIAGGSYRLEVYARTNITPLIGIAHIFLSPKTVPFQIQADGQYPAFQILRTKTEFENLTGPVGQGVAPGKEVSGTIYLNGTNGANLEDANLLVGLCRLDDTLCEGGNYIWSKTYPVTFSGETSIKSSFTAPVNPDAYAIRMELKDNSGRTVSLYRNRLVVEGKTLNIRWLHASYERSASGRNGQIVTLVSPSPDHYTRPNVTGASLKVTLTDKQGEIFHKEMDLPNITHETGFEKLEFNFTPDRDINEVTLCGELFSEEGANYDKYCYQLNLSPMKAGEIDAKWNYRSSKKLLEVELCAQGSGAAAVLISSKSTGALSAFQDQIGLNPCSNVSFTLEPGEYNLLVNNLDNSFQKNYDLVLVMNEIEGGGWIEPTEKPSILPYLLIFMAIIATLACAYYFLRKKGGEK